MKPFWKSANLCGILLAFLIMFPTGASAHCDGMDGPVVKAAQSALETGNVNLVLIWVRPEGETEIRRAFEHALAVRKLGPEAKRLADTFFFETLVRIHRAGEGAPYTGLKPAGRDLGPAIPAADRALETKALDGVLKLLRTELEHGLSERFQEATGRANFSPDDVKAGRAYVHAYVEFLHFVERVHEAMKKSGEAEGHAEHGGPQGGGSR